MERKQRFVIRMMAVSCGLIAAVSIILTVIASALIEEAAQHAGDDKKDIMIMILVSIAFIVAAVIYSVIKVKAIDHIIDEITVSLEHLAKGDLGIDIHEDALSRKDELGEIADCIKKIDDELGEVIHTTLKLADSVANDGTVLSESSEQASEASQQVTMAMEDISKGAVSQAESVEQAAHDTGDIGATIEEITERVNEMSEFAENMKNACSNAMNALQQLLSQNAEVVVSIKVIDHQINSTNEAVKNISAASDLITSISSQTNLLALNASIEAARAGEAGRGFAVVATEIGSLADQSQQATVEINNIVTKLIEESEKSVKTVDELSHNFEIQNQQLDSTRTDMHEMEVGVNHVTSSAVEINAQIGNLNHAKNSLLEIITDLSAISEENAAATEQTNASMEELNATFSVISQSAADLQDLARELHKEMNFFTLHD